ncbi:ATP-binding protein, partial [Salipiger sp. IMCC34102]|uniref:ATP-binding protein n=1 Tax=Salipiger sp. IMCC34102 TaxID=2510647 RepID=UPI00101C6E7A
VLALAQLAMTYGDQAAVNGILADGAASVLLCATSQEATHAWTLFKGGLVRGSPRPGQSRYEMPRRPTVLVAAETSPTGRATTLRTADAQLSQPGALVLVTDDLAGLTGAMARLPVTRLAPLCADALVWALRQTHSATGKLSEDALRAALPADAALARMSAALIGLALRERGPIRVARKLTELVAPVAPDTDGPTLEDLPGLGEAGPRLAQIVTDVAAYRAGRLDWAEIERGLLLAGPPGTGKTLLAAALARSLGASFFPTTLGDMQKRDSGGSKVIQEMSALFDSARAATAGGGLAVVFLDEIDSFASRDRPHDHNTSYFTSVTNTLLTHITEALTCEGIFVVSATNFPKHLDPALIRAGRLGARIDVRPPTVRQIPDVLRYHVGDDLAGTDLAPAARAAAGLTQAQLAERVTAARRRARAEGRAMSLDDLLV